jgi:hypothetical protein
MGRLALLAACLACSTLPAQSGGSDASRGKPRLSLAAVAAAQPRGPRPTATIHWQGVPLREAIGRLQPLFDEPVFVDRRVDPNVHVSLDISATSAEQVLKALAAEHELGVGRLGKLIYLGPRSSAEQLRATVAQRSKEIVGLPAELRPSLTRKQRLNWPRLSQPRQLVASAIEQCGWRIAEPERIPHDLWAAGELPELSVAEELTVLLIGFDLTFELRPADRSIQIVPLQTPTVARDPRGVPNRATARANAKRPTGGTKQMYTLRVQEKPVGAVLRELENRLHWVIQIDEEAIRAARKSLDQRVSFSVENVDQDKLLGALLTPAGLDYRVEGEKVRIIPRR